MIYYMIDLHNFVMNRNIVRSICCTFGGDNDVCDLVRVCKVVAVRNLHSTHNTITYEIVEMKDVDQRTSISGKC